MEEIDLENPQAPGDDKRLYIRVCFRAATYVMRVFVSLVMLIFCLVMIGLDRQPHEVYWAAAAFYAGYWLKGRMRSGIKSNE